MATRIEFFIIDRKLANHNWIVDLKTGEIFKKDGITPVKRHKERYVISFLDKKRYLIRIADIVAIAAGIIHKNSCFPNYAAFQYSPYGQPPQFIDLAYTNEQRDILLKKRRDRNITPNHNIKPDPTYFPPPYDEDELFDIYYIQQKKKFNSLSPLDITITEFRQWKADYMASTIKPDFLKPIKPPY